MERQRRARRVPKRHQICSNASLLLYLEAEHPLDLTNQSSNQSINQSINHQTTNESNNQGINKSTNHSSISQLIDWVMID